LTVAQDVSSFFDASSTSPYKDAIDHLCDRSATLRDAHGRPVSSELGGGWKVGRPGGRSDLCQLCARPLGALLADSDAFSEGFVAEPEGQPRIVPIGDQFVLPALRELLRTGNAARLVARSTTLYLLPEELLNVWIQ
jgi:hypothetical protein